MSSEQNYDKLTITLDGEEIGVFSGEVDWTQVERELDDGDHVLSLTYAKDGSSTRGSDAAWLADFAWTPAVAPEPDGWNVVDIGGKEVVADHDKAKAWCEANSVALENFAANYNDYLLNEAPGADGGIEIAGITRDLVKGVLLITVVRTKDSFALNAINGTIVLYASNILGAEFKPIASTEVTIAAEAESADLSIALPSESAAFYTVKIE